ncbi:AT-hook motif nuclear-localized protein 11-like [Primulina eburnea]|uniref:AT-hook motif nuclear-localized protein 11-like n=1 Tax=Primulina eburnea TaxID=1245227 RepID=UPI003C6CC0A0
MDGREGIAYQGSASYYFNRGGVGGSDGSGAGPNGHGPGGGSAMTQAREIQHPTPVFKNLSNPNIAMHPNIGVNGSAVIGSAFHVENSLPNFTHGMTMAPVPVAPPSGETVKKKRGRPRKYAPDKSNMSLGLSPLSAPTPRFDEINPSEKRRRGRPPGSGWKQQLAPLGEWMNSTVGLAFTPHVIHVGVGEDVAAKILAFAQQRPRALCILSANGSVSSVTLRQPSTSAGTVTYEGRFQILCLSGSYLLAETGGPRNRTGGLSISICNTDGRMIGGAIGGRLTAANPVQVVACSFVYGSTKAKTKAESETKDENYLLEESAEKSSTPDTAAPSHPNSGTSLWPQGSRLDIKNSQLDFDLMDG